jgi:hypothetical protein
MCKVHEDVEQLTVQVRGSDLTDGVVNEGTYSDNSIDIIEYLVDRVTGGSISVTTSILGDSIGVAFRQQRPLLEWINEILVGLDCYLVFDSLTNGIEIKRRYNGRYADADGVANVVNVFDFQAREAGVRHTGKDAIVLDSIVNHGVVYRPRKVAVDYNENHDPLSPVGVPKETRINLSRKWHSVLAENSHGTGRLKRVKSAAINQVDAQRLADDEAHRLSGRNESYTLTLTGCGHGLSVGDIGSLSAVDIIGGSVVEVLDWTEEFNRVSQRDETRLKVIVYG